MRLGRRVARAVVEGDRRGRDLDLEASFSSKMASFTRVSVDEMKFTPAHVEIVRGTSVRWEQSPKCMVRHCLEVVVVVCVLVVCPRHRCRLQTPLLGRMEESKSQE